jgi:hypothetical protein
VAISVEGDVEAFFGMADLLPDLFGRFALAGSGIGFVRGHTNRRERSAVHARQSYEFTLRVGDRDDGCFLELQRPFHDRVHDALCVLIVDGGK